MDMKNQFWCDISASVNAAGGIAEVYMYGVIGEGYGGVNANNILAELSPRLSDVSHMNIHVSSPGGDAFQGITLRSFFANHSASKTVFIDGSVASAATLAVALPGVKTLMAKGSEYVIHNPWAAVAWAGEADDFKDKFPAEALKLGNRLDKFRGQMVDIYEERTGLTPDKIGSMMDVETSLSPKEAVKLGFADEVSNQQAIAAYLPPQIAARFKHSHQGFTTRVLEPRDMLRVANEEADEPEVETPVVSNRRPLAQRAAIAIAKATIDT